ncbi:hypothetical protein [Candidatus Uabimicrobium sp. HlEnr_7]|uniref:SWIM zinc finger family protein n=1 Tax=Candidatus Uabimicrobium helgolandensis TaxID=3095367 RepID=UPI0035575873
MDYWGDYKPYVTAAEKKKIAQKKLAKLRKENPNIQPIVVKGKKLVSTWWGKAWNSNLEYYADYDNRISRGRSYVRQGSVLDLKIRSGNIDALVQGSETYKINIEIQPIQQEKWLKIQSECAGEFDSLQNLLDGKFPKSLGEIFTKQKTGLFPSLSEISFRCNCLDWADMCKHITAVLYGVGVRLDSSPALFFTLRNVEIDSLVKKAVQDKKLSFLQKAKQKSSRVIADSDLSFLFGIDIGKITSIDTHEKHKEKTNKKPLKPQNKKASKKSSNPGKRQLSSKTKKPTDSTQKTKLNDSQKRVLKLLSRKKSCSPSDKIFAKQAKVGETYLRVILEELASRGYAKKQKNRGKVIFLAL